MSNAIYELIPKIMKDVGAVGKTGFNSFDKYKFRSIDDVYNSLQPALAENKVFIIPKVLTSIENTVQTKAGADQVRVKVKVEYDICAFDGSKITAIFEGEGIDRSDKATNKAMQASFKFMVSQLFCLAFEGMDDADKESPEFVKPQSKQINKITENNIPKSRPQGVVNHAIQEQKPSPEKESKPIDFENEKLLRFGNHIIGFGINAGKQIKEIKTDQLETMIKKCYSLRDETQKPWTAAMASFVVNAELFLKELANGSK